MIRWFGRWLRDDDTGVDREPPIRVFVRHATRPEPDLAHHEGVWRYEPAWPLERSRPLVLIAHETGPDRTDKDTLSVRPDVGVRAWISCAGALPWGQSQDLREDDAWSLTYDWPVEAEPLEILGHPSVRLRLRSDAAVASLSAKLEDVFPDGTSALVTRGFLNLTHRAGSTAPVPIADRRGRRGRGRAGGGVLRLPARAPRAPGAGRDRLAQHLATAGAGDARRRPEQRPARAADRGRSRSGGGAAALLGATSTRWRRG